MFSAEEKRLIKAMCRILKAKHLWFESNFGNGVEVNLPKE
jgi:hypothetical protein